MSIKCKMSTKSAEHNGCIHLREVHGLYFAFFLPWFPTTCACSGWDGLNFSAKSANVCSPLTVYEHMRHIYLRSHCYIDCILCHVSINIDIKHLNFPGRVKMNLSANSAHAMLIANNW